jgi:hypothetical protein
MADMTINWPRLTWPALAQRHAGGAAGVRSIGQAIDYDVLAAWVGDDTAGVTTSLKKFRDSAAQSERAIGTGRTARRPQRLPRWAWAACGRTASRDGRDQALISDSRYDGWRRSAAFTGRVLFFTRPLPLF